MPSPGRWRPSPPRHRRRRADDDRVEGASRRVVGAGDDACSRRPAPRVPGAGDAGVPRPVHGDRGAVRAADLLHRGSVRQRPLLRTLAPGRRPEPKPGKPGKAHPGFVLWTLVRVHPELRRRAKAARRAHDERLWRQDLREWEPTLGCLAGNYIGARWELDETDSAARNRTSYLLARHDPREIGSVTSVATHRLSLSETDGVR